MQKLITLVPEFIHTTSKNEKFEITLKKKVLSEQHNYWLYFVDACHEKWRKAGFGIFVTKQAYPQEELADHLAKTLALDECKARLEEVTEEGRPLYFPGLHEGWAIM